MRVVLDTNVLVSGLLSPYDYSAEIVRLVASGKLELCLDARLLCEYQDVLHRPKFDFDAGRVDAFLAQVEGCGIIVASSPLPIPLPDSDDDAFLEVALTGRAKGLVTGNLVHFPKELRQGMRVLSPAEFVEFYRIQGGAFSEND